MNTILRGIRNAFRNSIRTTSIVIILGLSIGLALTMLVARQAVAAKISSVKASLGNTVTIAPAGGDFGDASNALTTTQLAGVKGVAHVSGVAENLTDRLSTTGSAQVSFGGRSATSSSTTSLSSPVKLNANRNGGSGGGFFVRGGGQLPANFTPPVQFIGTSDPTSLDGSALSIKSGQALDGSVDSGNAMVSTDMASKNNLQVGSTFTAYSTTLKVAAIFDSGNQGGNNEVILSLPTIQRLSGQGQVVTNATAQIDSVDNLSSATTAIKNLVGSNADVTNSADQINNAIAPLNNIKSISAVSLIGAVVAGSVIILLTMLMIVRERRREIGVLKAIGASNIKVMAQFMTEAVTFTLLGAIVGLGLGVLGAGPVTKLLVTTSSNTSSSGAGPGGGGGFARGAGGFARAAGLNGTSLRNLHAVVGLSTVGYGLLAALVIALVGSAIPAGLLAKIRPAEVMRAE